MNASVATNKFKSLLRDILANTTIKLGKVLSKFIYNCVVTLVSIRGRVNFLQLMRHSSLNEKTFRNNFSKSADWIGINDEIALRELPDAAHRVVVIDPAHISKAGRCTPGIARYWSGVAGQAKRGLKITAIAAIDFTTKHTVMLGAEQTLPDKNGNKLSMNEFYIQTIKDNKDKLQKISKTLAADAFFARKPFADAMVEIGFTFVSRFASNCVLKYLPNEQWLAERGVKRGKKPKYAGKVVLSAPDKMFLDKAGIPEASGAWTGIVWSNALRRKVRVVIVKWDKGNRAVYFSTDTKWPPPILSRFTAAVFRLNSEYATAGSSQACIIPRREAGSGWPSPSTFPFLHATCCRPKLTDISREIRSANPKTPSRIRNLLSESLNMPFQTA